MAPVILSLISSIKTVLYVSVSANSWYFKNLSFFESTATNFPAKEVINLSTDESRTLMVSFLIW